MMSEKCICCGKELGSLRYDVYRRADRITDPATVIGSICEECLEEDSCYHICDTDGKVYEEDSLVWLTDREVWITLREAYLNDDYQHCDDCGEWYHVNNVYLDDYGNVVCHRCYDRHYWSTCENCGRLIPDGYTCYDDDTDQTLCEDCYDELQNSRPIHEYAYKPSPIFHTTPGEDTKLFMGVELEIDRPSNYRYSDPVDPGLCSTKLKDISKDETLFYQKHDCSLSEGIEIVTHPCSISYHLKEFPWQKIRDIAISNNFRSHETTTCGLHVHVSRNGLGADRNEQDLTIAKIILLMDRMWDNMVRFSRRNYARINDWARKPDAYIEKGDSEETAIRKSKDTSDTRYRAVNLTNYSTVEFRLFRGSLNVNTIKATLEFLHNLITYAMSHTLAETQDVTWVELIESFTTYPELTQYLAERGLDSQTAPQDELVENEDTDTDGDMAA